MATTRRREHKGVHTPVTYAGPQRRGPSTRAMGDFPTAPGRRKGGTVTAWVTAVLLGAGLFLGTVGRTDAVSILQTLGEQDFADGSFQNSTQVAAAGANEPAPFADVIGSDVGGPNFAASWTFTYGVPATDAVTAAALTLGIQDHDSAASGNQVASFTLNGTLNLTAALNALFEASPGANSQARVYTLTLPSATFAALGTGTATFALALQGPGLGILGELPTNGAALDFATLNLTTQAPIPVPEPSSLLLCLLGLATIGAWRWRRARVRWPTA